MITGQPSRPARAVLRLLAGSNEPLSGDLLEEFHRGRSERWLWGQLLLAGLHGSFQRRQAPVALNLTPIDPVVAEWLMSRRLPARPINLSAPGEGIGGLGLMMLGMLLTSVVPDVWWFVVGGIGSGVALGATKAYLRRNHALPDAHDRYFT
jgi:hypothetical protein